MMIILASRPVATGKSYDVTDVTDGNNDDGDNVDGDWNVDENITHVMSIAQQSWSPVGNCKGQNVTILQWTDALYNAFVHLWNCGLGPVTNWLGL